MGAAALRQVILFQILCPQQSGTFPQSGATTTLHPSQSVDASFHPACVGSLAMLRGPQLQATVTLPRPSGLWFLPPGDHMGLRLQDWAALLEEDEDVSPRLL